MMRARTVVITALIVECMTAGHNPLFAVKLVQFSMNAPPGSMRAARTSLEVFVAETNMKYRGNRENREKMTRKM